MLANIEGVLARVVQAGAAAWYDFQMRLLTATQVSQSAPIHFGVLAGRNEFAAQVLAHHVVRT